ncbi:MAG: hypothetical protein JXQ85_05115 [Cognatishimia sp.]|uniref:hypothetical protein n=1 Tax=Cognatishimia sp. TaxID=2211648 RepID=UPI003B8B1384
MSTPEAFVKKHEKQLHRLEGLVRMHLNYQQVMFAFSRLDSMDPQDDPSRIVPFVAEVDCWTSVVAVGYGRVFTEAEGAFKMSRSKVPAQYRNTHDDVMSLRHEIYAHTGNHDEYRTRLVLEVTPHSVQIEPQYQRDIVLGARAGWKQLLEWLDGAIQDQITKQLMHLNTTTDREWSIKSESN